MSDGMFFLTSVLMVLAPSFAILCLCLGESFIKAIFGGK